MYRVYKMGLRKKILEKEGCGRSNCLYIGSMFFIFGNFNIYRDILTLYLSFWLINHKGKEIVDVPNSIF